MPIKIFFNFFKNIISVRNFIYLNKSIFKKKIETTDQNIILVEFNAIFSSIISYSLVANFLSEKFNAKIIGFNVYNKNFIKKIFNFILPYSLPKVYYSFGVKKIIYIKRIKNNKSENYKFRSKKEFLNFTVDGIIIGDLIYDSYLRQKYKSTIDLESNEFKKFLNSSIETFNFWNTYFKNNNIKAVIASHSVYNLGFPVRIAVKNNIPAYMTGISFLNLFNSKRIFEINANAYKEYYQNLNKEQKIEALDISKKIIEKKFNEQNGYANSTELYQSSTPYVISDKKYETFGKIKKKNILIKNNKPNILITAHCFYDSPHAVENLLFNDFYEWIVHLGNLSNETDYNWYIKKHPHTANKNLNNKTLRDINKKYPKLEILEENINNSELINEGIDLTLTVYGSVGYEFPYFDIPVLLASKNTPYEGYNFCLQPATIAQYDFYIKNLASTKYKVNKKEIYEFYFNRYLANWSLLDNYVENKLHLKNEFFGPKILDVWKKQISKEKMKKINFEIDSFIKKKKYRLISGDAYMKINYTR